MTERVHLPDLDGEGRGVLFEGEPRTVRLALEAGESVPPHQHPDRDVVCHLLEGELTMTLDETDHRMRAGDVLRFDGDRDISPTAVTDAVALLVLADPLDGRPRSHVFVRVLAAAPGTRRVGTAVGQSGARPSHALSRHACQTAVTTVPSPVSTVPYS
ncbi:MAG: cupin domain-containing protein [Haloarculaceae archaeon]